ncbi:hypothetical protein JCM11251_000095 [Rhodosporidiobolus azoricus]
MSTPVAKHQGLYALQLPPTLLPHLRPRQLVIPEHHPLYRPSEPAPSSTLSQDPSTPRCVGNAAPEDEKEGGQFKCALTGARFDSLQGLREHYKSDWYRYNVKLKLRGEKTPVSEGEFERRVGDLSDSLSGSDSSTSSSSASEASDASGDESDSRLSRLLRRHHSSHKPSNGAPGEVGEEGDDLEISSGGRRSAVLWFDTPPGEGKEGEAEKPTQYGIYRAILPTVGGLKRSSPTEGSDALAELKSLQLGEDESGGEEGKKWTLLMFGGGHFAGMVVSLKPRLVGKGKGKEKDREVVVLERKTFHRYTTRRKQGGGQGAYDAAGGKAKSIGAQIRRHNEQALNDEVRALLLSWQPLLLSSDLVFLRCSKSNYRTFFGYEGSPLDLYKRERGDERIRGFTFPTRRPTLAELLRSFLELTRVKTTHLSASELADLDSAYLASITPKPSLPPPPAKPFVEEKKKDKDDKKPKLTKLEELERDRWTRLVEMVKKGRVEALTSFLDKYGPELESGLGGGEAGAEGEKLPWGTLPEWMDEAQRTPTLLHIASAADQPSTVRWLLEVKRADPTLHASHSSTPYDLAPSRAVRNQFRFLAHSHADWWDWLGTGVGGARVPSGLDEEKERERERKEEEKREKIRARQIEREEAEVAAREAERAAKEAKEARERADQEAAKSLAGKAGPQRLGGSGGGAVLQARRREEERGGLSEVQRARVEREERARAAEERLRRLAGGGGA